ncbi:MAG: hypothetical protein MJK18_09755, partial [Bdellovibrionales bacterium]|nr:hypothetical protein [Bdellovibrionales bacterium]
ETASLPTMKNLRECYQTQDCDFPNKDPSEYNYSVGQEIKKQLNKAYKRILRGEETRISYWSQEAIKSLKVSDGHVKEAALEVISTQPPSPQAFEKLLTDVIEYHDPLLIAQALAELQKYQEPQYQVRIYQTLSKVLNSGSLLVKKEIVYNIVPFLNKQSLPYFQDSLKKMNPSSNVHTVLFKILKDYRTQQTGA